MLSPENLEVLSAYLRDIASKTRTLTIKEEVTDDEIVLGNLACLIEEVGELSAEIRKKLKMSFSAKKVAAFELTDLEDEAVDVVITLGLLLQSLGIEDLESAIARKIKKNNERGYR